MAAPGLTRRPPGASTGRPPARGSAGPPKPAKRLRPASDEKLVAKVRDGSQEAFTALWERYHRPLLSYCRQMLSSHHEAEDAVQQAFANAYHAMARDDERELHVRPWLYRIARNQCLSILRTRRPTDELGGEEPSLVGLSDEVAGRADLRALLQDLAALPTDQREALVLAELHDNSHAEVAEILGCAQSKVKSLVFQARTSLMQSREAREVRCEDVQSQLSVLRGGSLRRTVLRRHLAECEACRLFGAEVKRQRAALAMVLPVAPTGALKLGAASAFAAAGATTASTAGTASTVGVGAGIAAKLGVPATLLKGAATTLVVTTAAAGGVATTAEVAQDVTRDSRPPITQKAVQAPPPAAGQNAAQRPAADRGAAGQRRGAALLGKPVDKLHPDKSLPPGLSKPANGAVGPPRAHPQKPGSNPQKHQGARPLKTKRPAPPVRARKPADRPVRARPRPRPKPSGKLKPAQPAEPTPPAADGSPAVP